MPGKQAPSPDDDAEHHAPTSSALSRFFGEYGLPGARSGSRRRATITAPWRYHLSRAGVRARSWSRRSAWPGRGRLCTTAGTRTIRRTRRSSCTCFRSARSSSSTIRWSPATNDIQEIVEDPRASSRASKTELWHRILTHYLPLYFPEADRFHRSSRTDWFLAFLEALSLTALHLRHEQGGVHRGRVDGNRAQACRKSRLLSDIYETAKHLGRACPSGPTSRRDPRCSAWCWRKGRSLIRAAQRDRGARRRAAVRIIRLPAAAHDPRDRPDQRLDDSGGGRRPAPLPPSPTVPEVLRHGPGDRPVRHVPRPDARCRSTAMPACGAPSGWRARSPC